MDTSCCQPWSESPQPYQSAGGSSNDPKYVHFTTKDVIHRAHEADTQDTPWTVDTEFTINKLIDDGVGQKPLSEYSIS